MRFIPTRIHGMLDYLMGALLIVAPWLLGFDRGGAETWVPVILGAGVIVYSLLTDYELGVVKKLPMSTHLMMDLVGGIILAISPWLFGFSEYVYLPHLILGLAEIGAAVFTKRVPDTATAHTHHTNTADTRTADTRTDQNARIVNRDSRPPMGSNTDTRTRTESERERHNNEDL